MIQCGHASKYRKADIDVIEKSIKLCWVIDKVCPADNKVCDKETKKCRMI